MERTRTPGIYRRGNRYVVVWRHRGRQHKSFHRTYAEAREAKGVRQSGDSRPSSKVRFGDYFEEWIVSYAGRTARGLTPRSLALYRGAIEDRVRPRWEHWRLSDIEPADVRRLYIEQRAKGLSTSGMRLLRTALSALFTTALEDGLVRTSPVTGIRLPPGPPNAPEDALIVKAMTCAELSALLAALPPDWHLFLAHTGLRISEALGLTWEHVDLGPAPRVMIRQQICDGEVRRLKSSDSRRTIPLSPGMAARLRESRLKARPDRGSPVFTTDSKSPLSRPNLAGRVLKPAGKAAGLTAERDGKEVVWISFHTFRHTCASLLFQEGRNVKQVADWLGHADPAFTLRTYVHLMDSGVGDADFFDHLVAPSSGAPLRPPDKSLAEHS
jgi:integrase